MTHLVEVAEMAKAPEEMCEEQEVPSRFEWRIPRVKSFLLRQQNMRQSPPHSFCGGEWIFLLRKMGSAVALSITRLAKTDYHKNHLEWKLIIIENEDTEYIFSEGKCTVANGTSIHSCSLDERRLHSIGERTEFDVKIICLIKCFHCKPPPQTVLSKRFDSLDLMDLFVSGEDSDVTIKVKDREFRVHKCIIRSRSPVFFSMFSRDILESNSGTFDITDCDAEAFQTFMEYIYSGQINCSRDGVQDLYYIADKYQATEVKAECVKFMSQNLSVENFCDTVAFSLRHEESALRESAHQFFARNSKDVIRTSRWQSFLTEEPAAATDFFIRLFTRKRKLYFL